MELLCYIFVCDYVPNGPFIGLIKIYLYIYKKVASDLTMDLYTVIVKGLFLKVKCKTHIL